MKTTLPAAALMAFLASSGALADPPVAAELRLRSGATELVLPGQASARRALIQDACSATLSVSVPVDIGSLPPPPLGGVLSLSMASAETLVVGVPCGARVELKSRRGDLVLAVSAVPMPVRKPGPGPAPARNIAATPSGDGAEGAAPPPPSESSRAERIQTAGAPVPMTEGETRHVRKAVADALDAVERDPVTPSAGPAPDGEAMPPSASTGPAPRPAEPPAAQGAVGGTSPVPAALAPAASPAPPPAPALFDLAAWRTEPFRARRSALREAAARPDAPEARRDFARFLLAWGLGPEAAAAARAAGDVPLLAAATLLEEPDATAADWLAGPEALTHADGPLWAAVLLARRGRPAEALPLLPGALKALPALPADLRGAFALDLLAMAAGAGRDSVGRDLARIAEEAGLAEPDQARLHLLIGRLHEGTGRKDLALEQYDKAAVLPGESAARARLAAADLRFARGDLDAPALHAVLEELARDWRGGEVEFRALARQAELSRAERRPVEALDTLRLLIDRFPTSEALAAETARAGGDFAALLAAGPAPDLVAAFERNRALLPAGRPGLDLRIGYARLLTAQGLTMAAARELAQVAQALPPAETAAVRQELAALELAAGRPDAVATLVPEDTPDARAVRARAAAATGNLDTALDLIGTPKDTAGLTARGDALWRSARWTEAARTYGLLVEALSALRAGDPGRAGLADAVGRLGVAAYLAGDAAAPRRLLTAHADLLAGGPWASQLAVLAGDRSPPAGTAGMDRLLAETDALLRLSAAGRTENQP